jgi:Zn-dependent protease with chaperone function
MSPLLVMGFVLLAAYGLSMLLFSALIALVWRAALQRRAMAATDLLTLRVLPSAGGILIVLTVVLPAFMSCEPHRNHESVGPLVIALATLATASLFHGLCRGCSAWRATRSLLRRAGPVNLCTVEKGQQVQLLDVVEPVVGVVGGWRPRIVASRCVISVCSRDEFREVIAHETAHIRSRDNLKLLLIVGSPDVLAWTTLGTALMNRWREAAELDADRRATSGDPRKSVALASALIKVARLAATGRTPLTLSMPAASESIDSRVRRLLAPSVTPRAIITRTLAATAFPALCLAIPLYSTIHQVIEALVGFGR